MTTTLWRRVRLGLAVALPTLVGGIAVGSLAGADDRLSDIPAAVVNEDQIITTTAEDGTEQQMFAGRQIVTELTGGDAEGFDWRITNADEAAQWLADGEVYAVVTIPNDFSTRVTSLQGDNPQQAGIEIETDSAHDALSPAVAAQVGEAVAASLSDTVTAGFVAGVYGGMGQLSGQLGTAAQGAHELATGSASLGDGLATLAGGQAQLATATSEAATGASALADGANELGTGLQSARNGAASLADGADGLSAGVAQYTGGVDQLATGLQALSAGTAALQNSGAQLSDVETGIDGYADAAQQLAAGLALNPAIDPGTLQQVQGFADSLSGFATQTDQLAGAGAGLSELAAGIQQSSDGAAQLAAGSAGLRGGATELARGADALTAGISSAGTGATQLSTGTAELAGGLGELATGQQQLADGATQSVTGATGLTDGATQLATGLDQAVAAIPALDQAQVDELSNVAADPVGSTLNDSEELDGGESIASIAVPLALWLGAIATLLALGGLTRRQFGRSVSTTRLTLGRVVRTLPIAGAQALLVVIAAHVLGGVDWALAPATLGVAALTALVATLAHVVLVELWGRGGIVVSLGLLAIQFVVAGLVPPELLPAPIAALRALTPLPHGVDALRAVMTGSTGDALTAAAALGLWAIGLLLAAIAAVAHARRRSGLASLVPAPAPA